MGENDSMLDMYLFESSMLLDQLDDILLQSEKDENLSAENINEIFRIMHTIKGSSAMMEFDLLSHVAHKIEDLFYFVRENSVEEEYFQDLMDLTLEVSDFLKEEVDKIRDNRGLTAENHSLIEKISELLRLLEGELPAEKMQSKSGSTAGRKQSKSGPTAGRKQSKSEPSAGRKQSKGELLASEVHEGAAEKSQDEVKTYYLHVHFAPDCQMENVRAFLLINKLESLGEILRTIPGDLSTNQSASGIITKNGFYCSFSSCAPLSEIEAAIKGASSVDQIAFVDGLPSDTGAEETSVEIADPQHSSMANSKDNTRDNSKETDSSPSCLSKANGSKQNLISVDLNKLDTLMDLVGEIVITESMVSGSPDLHGLTLENFNKASRQLRKLTDELQDIVMSIRMVPVASTFQKMRRVVRDMNKKLSRDVNLVLMGESTEVDKTIIDAIVDPLMHLVRNAMDHGIEDKADRIAAQKEPNGQIILSAQNVAGEIIITVSDDGRGLDAAYILEKAKSKNLLTKPENEYTEKEIFNFLTLPGFSTKDSVTEFSGRGVGMDVVRKNIEKIGGAVTIESKKNAGTTVFFKMPLTLAIIPSMEIQVGKEIYAIPISNIRESFKASSSQIFTDPDNNEMIMIRGACYPVIRLDRIYHIEDSYPEIDDSVLLLVASPEGMACLVADEILGKHQVVVKPLPPYLARFNVSSMGISGCTILGSGNISLILDVQGILNQY